MHGDSNCFKIKTVTMIIHWLVDYCYNDFNFNIMVAKKEKNNHLCAYISFLESNKCCM